MAGLFGDPYQISQRSSELAGAYNLLDPAIKYVDWSYHALVPERWNGSSARAALADWTHAAPLFTALTHAIYHLYDALQLLSQQLAYANELGLDAQKTAAAEGVAIDSHGNPSGLTWALLHSLTEPLPAEVASVVVVYGAIDQMAKADAYARKARQDFKATLDSLGIPAIDAGPVAAAMSPDPLKAAEDWGLRGNQWYQPQTTVP